MRSSFRGRAFLHPQVFLILDLHQVDYGNNLIQWKLRHYQFLELILTNSLNGLDPWQKPFLMPSLTLPISLWLN